MPLDKSMSHEEMVAELINSYKKTGKIGATEPRDMNHALEIANAVAYNLDENNIAEEVKEMNLEEMLKALEAYVTSKEKELGIFNEINNELKIDSSLHKGKEAEYYKNNLQGKTVTHPVLGDIYLGKKGRNETLYKSPSKYMGILCDIDKIIEGGYSNGLLDEPNHPRKDSFTGFYYVYNEVMYDNTPLGITVEIGEARDGKKYYMFKAYTNEKFYRNSEVLLSEKEANQAGKTSNNSITDNDENVKPGDKFMLGDYIEITILDPKDKSAEKDEALNQKPTVKVTLNNGETFETEVDPNTSEDDLKKQYAVGAEINVGRAGQERKAKITSTTITKPVGERLEIDFDDTGKLYGVDTKRNHKFGNYDEVPAEWLEFLEDSNSTFYSVAELFNKKGYLIHQIGDEIETGYIRFTITPDDWRKHGKSSRVMEISRVALVSNNAYEVAQEIANEAYDRYPELFQTNKDFTILDNPTDVISMDVPLFLRLLEWAREEATEDIELHDVAEKAIAIMQNGTEFLTMDDYNNIVGIGCCTGIEPPIDDSDVNIIETDMGDMGADPILPIGKKSKAKTLKNKKLKDGSNEISQRA